MQNKILMVEKEEEIFLLHPEASNYIKPSHPFIFGYSLINFIVPLCEKIL